jgi:Flp pilus assembly pilin Flp
VNTIKNFLDDETGLELSEYAVVAALVVAAIVVAYKALGTAIASRIGLLTSTISAN